MKYKLIAADIDGTLLNSRKELTAATEAAIKEARDKGMLFTAATGRPMRGLRSFSHILTPGVPVVTYNGAVVLLPDTGREIYSLKMTAASAEEIIRRGGERGASVIAWCDNEIYALKKTPRTEKYREVYEQECHIIDNEAQLARRGITKIMWLDTVERTIDHKRKPLPPEVRSCISEPGYLEFMHERVSKSTGLRLAADYLGIERSEVIAFGDGDNDTDMLSWAGLGVAMGNAAENVKAAAKKVAETNDNDGLAEFINSLEL